MEQFVVDQIKSGLKYLPANLGKSYFIPKKNAETEAFRKKGFIRGVCHPNENFAQLREANIGWIRIDIPYPFEKDGSLREHYIGFKKKCERFHKNGIRVMAVTPYPEDYIEDGADVRTEEGREKLKAVARFLAEDMQDTVDAFQITNEMGIPHFTLPLTMAEAVQFIALHLETIYPIKGRLLIGYNSAGPQADLHAGLKPYLQYVDYVGVDIYIGCFDTIPGAMFMFDSLLRYLWAFTHKPILMQEFGYISGGKPKTKKEKRAVLERYGVSSEADAEKEIDAFVERLPKTMKEHVKHVCENDPSRYAGLLFRSDFKNHFYSELPAITKIPGYEHTPEGQAKFYADILPHLYSLPYVCGSIIYCYMDSERCYICGQNDCPTETRWGLVDCDGNPKPSFYAVQKAFGRMQWNDTVSNK